jgi:hypothetical protein
MKTILTTACLSVLLAMQGCGDDAMDSDERPAANMNSTELNVGGVYASKNEDGQFSITKILALDESAVHVRAYNEKFDTLPTTIDTAELTFLIGHMPMAREGYLQEEHTLISVEQVSEQELEGYRMYLEAMQRQ